jgi:hypothetical protein
MALADTRPLRSPRRVHSSLDSMRSYPAPTRKEGLLHYVG